MFHRSTSIFAVTAAAAAVASPAMAQNRQFDIPAQSVPSAVSMFGRQSGLQIVAPADIPASVRSNAVKGFLDARAALRMLINGSGLEIASDTGSVIVLRMAPAAAVKADEGAEAERQDIVVTAQRREERLQDVPVAVTVLSSKQLENQRIQNLQDISRVTPGLLVSTFNYASPTIALRGASNTFNQIGVNRPVAVVVDDVFITRASAAVFNLFDLDSVQVLRGPQGTLFGRNVTGGAIVMTTRKPSFKESEFAGSVSYGNYNAVELNGLVAGPVSENVAVNRLLKK